MIAISDYGCLFSLFSSILTTDNSIICTFFYSFSLHYHLPTTKCRRPFSKWTRMCFLSSLFTNKFFSSLFSSSFCAFFSWIIYDDNNSTARLCIFFPFFSCNLPPVVNDMEHSQKFREHEYEVTRKDGLVFLREMAAEVKNFMDFKMNAVMVSHFCIIFCIRKK